MCIPAIFAGFLCVLSNYVRCLGWQAEKGIIVRISGLSYPYTRLIRALSDVGTGPTAQNRPIHIYPRKISYAVLLK